MSNVIGLVGLVMCCDFICLFLSVSYPFSISTGCLETYSWMHRNGRKRSGKPLRSYSSTVWRCEWVGQHGEVVLKHSTTCYLALIHLMYEVGVTGVLVGALVVAMSSSRSK